MKRPNLHQDIKPLSEFRANAAQMVEQVRTSKRPLILTQNGRSAAVLIDVGEYENLLDKLELLQELQTAEQQIKEGSTLTHSAAKRQALARLKK